METNNIFIKIPFWYFAKKYAWNLLSPLLVHVRKAYIRPPTRAGKGDKKDAALIFISIAVFGHVNLPGMHAGKVERTGPFSSAPFFIIKIRNEYMIKFQPLCGMHC